MTAISMEVPLSTQAGFQILNAVKFLVHLAVVTTNDAT
jgi:hypothetical protein